MLLDLSVRGLRVRLRSWRERRGQQGEDDHRGPAPHDALRALTFTDTTEANALRSGLPAGSASRPTV